MSDVRFIYIIYKTFEGGACFDEVHDKAAEYVALNSKQ